MLGSKKRIVVDKNIFLDTNREAKDPNIAYIVNGVLIDPNIGNIINSPGGAKKLGGFYIPYDEVDTLRVALGRYWDYEAVPTVITGVATIPDLGMTLEIGPTSEKIFGHEHPAVNVIFGRPITWHLCDDPIEYLNIGGHDNHFGGFKQTFVFSTSFEANLSMIAKELGISSLTSAQIDEAGYTRNFHTYWTYVMKTGIITSNNLTLKPVIKSTNYDSNQVYHDHYHEVLSPYTPGELNSQPTVGVALHADYKTYYNDRTYSKDYENFIANPIYHNSLPNIHALAKVASNPALEKNSFLDLSNMIEYMESWYKDPLLLQDPSTIRNDTYTDLFQQFPLEASILLFGAMAEPSGIDPDKDENEIGITLERLVSLDTKKVDADSLFKRYLEKFRNVLLNNPFLSNKPLSSEISPAVELFGGSYAIAPGVRVGALEHINSNLLFGSNASTILHKANQYKDYFPMYCEINFTAQKTHLGEIMKKSKIISFLGHQIAAAQDIYGWGVEDLGSVFHQNTAVHSVFVDYIEKSVYDNIIDLAPVSVPALSETWTATYKEETKKVIDLISPHFDNPGIVDKWVEEDDYSSLNSHAIVQPSLYDDTEFLDIDSAALEPGAHEDFLKDVRNYIAYIRNDFEDPYELTNECNPLFKALYGSSFGEHLKNIYNEKARTYSDMLNGAPAHSEDLFYVIKKFKTDANSTEEINTQNIIIPNTSDLDIVSYVDTQVKYGSHATYRYEVFVYRVVFGSKYYYTFPDESQIAIPDAQGSPATLIDPANVDYDMPLYSHFYNNITYEPQPAAETVTYEKSDTINFNFTARVEVSVEPSIKLIGDKMFETLPIKILDSPPVPPFVDIVPYRAMGDRVRIILEGSTDTYRETPILMLEGDDVLFSDIKASQFSQDGKVEFSSDDRIANFQTFRIEERPKSYDDFMLHPNEDFAIIETGGNATFDDSILSNKKYYYTFRAVDNHGHVSNPTPVYEVELINEKGAVKPIIRTISMEPKENKTSSKEIQKYLLIKPTDRQIYFSDDPDVNSIFSTEVEQDNKKKYKMRITSKGTGKKIDINFSFTKKDVS